MSDDLIEAMAEAIDPHGCNWRNGLGGPLKQRARGQARAALAAIEAAGWAVVPRDRAAELDAENQRLRGLLVDANNFWRHEFSTEVEAATDKLFKRLAAHRTINPKPPKP
jgi:hypothetical protein